MEMEARQTAYFVDEAGFNQAKNMPQEKKCDWTESNRGCPRPGRS
jgi:hypothetical protein